MAKGVIVLVLLIIMFILGVLIFFQLRPEPEKRPGLKNELASVKPIQTSQEAPDNTTAEEEAVGGTEEPVEPVGEISGGGSGGGGGGESDIVPEDTTPKLPDDLYTASCGTYFTRYDICAGSCANGICTQEGRSCYCKLQE